MADSLNPWIQGYLNSVAQQHGANYTKAKRVKEVKVQLIKTRRWRCMGSYIGQEILDAIMFTQAAIAAYVKNNKGPPSFSKLSTALVTLQEALLAFRPIPIGDKIGVTDEYYLYLECHSFAISSQHQNDKIWKKPEDIMKDTKIKTYVEGLRRDGGGGNVYLEKRTQSQTRSMNNKFQDDFNALPSPQNGQQSKSPKKTVREDPFWKDLNETNWNIKLQRAQATPSLTDSEEQMKTATPAKRKPDPADASTDQTESSQDDDSMSDASNSDSSVSQPLTNWSTSPKRRSPAEADENSSPTSSPSLKRSRSTAPLKATSARSRQPVLLSSPPTGTVHLSDDEEEEQEVASSLSSPGRPILTSRFPGSNSRKFAEAGPSKPGTPIPLVPKKSPFLRPSSPGSHDNVYTKSRSPARPAHVADESQVPSSQQMPEVPLQRHTRVDGRLSPNSDDGQTGSQLKEKFRAIKTVSQGEPPSFGDLEEDDGDSLFSGDGDIAFSSDSPQSDGEASDFPAADGDSISVNLPGTQRDMDIDDGDDEASRASSARPEVGMDVEGSSDSDVHMEQAHQIDEIRDTVMKDVADDTASPGLSHLSQPKALSEDDRQVNDDLFGDSGSHIGEAEQKYVLRSPRPPDENYVANQKEALEHNREAWEQPTFMRQNIIGPSQSINPEQTSDAHPDESDLPAHNTTTARSGRSSVAGRDNQMDGGGRNVDQSR
ncbi:hypothetical protein CPB85DRAFT_1429433 [Mucidula mucida]|nr:hypothetical protein CPB85DRAFT_1429433 [Mucidula mucida]